MIFHVAKYVDKIMIKNYLYKTKLFNIRKAISLTFPMFCAFLALGMAFGYFALQLGLSWHLILIMTTIVYAGSSEFIIAFMFAENAPGVDIILAAALCNLRHIFYGMSVYKYFPTKGAKRLYMVYTLSDETFAILASHKSMDKDLGFLICLLNHLYWILGVACGLTIGYWIDFTIDGLEFILTALFIVLTIEQIYQVKKLAPFAYALIASVISIMLFPSYLMLIISMIIVTILLIVDRRIKLKLVKV